MIGRDAGVSVISCGAAPRPRPVGAGADPSGPGFATATFVSLNSGMKRDTGSLRRIFPSSTSIRMATPVTGLLIDAMRKMPSFRIGVFDSRSIIPCASKCAIFPRRVTTVTAPAISFAAM